MLPLLIPLLIYCAAEASRYSHTHEDDLHFSNSEEGPRIDRHSFFKQSYRLGYKLSLFCEAHGRPRPDMRWYKNGVELLPKPGLRIRNSVAGDTLSSHLDIDPAGVMDAGEYECVANNSYGYHLEHMRAQYRLKEAR
ncbi:immunoglobulin domain protein [Oesophagostomum dentatum]|uniref:Immunoglobulin domain protein n=1 Tax=Oesophagostomum dentatum TaxID=61180 RepID=A0A0B1T3M2_OESDE|nr:immunoglobulin domain protein [Oesophagostomum dentatum]